MLIKTGNTNSRLKIEPFKKSLPESGLGAIYLDVTGQVFEWQGIRVGVLMGLPEMILFSGAAGNRLASREAG